MNRQELAFPYGAKKIDKIVGAALRGRALFAKRTLSAKRTNNSSRGCPGAKRQAPPVRDSPRGIGPRKRSHFSLTEIESELYRYARGTLSNLKTTPRIKQ